MIIVSPLEYLDATAARHRPSHVLTLLSPGHESGAEQQPPFEHHLELRFHDITEARPGLIAPNVDHIRSILDFAQGWDTARPLLVHCWAGISRSSAAAYLIACNRNPGDEEDIALELRRRAPFATPNARMVAIADRALQRSGRMIEAIVRIGRGADAFLGSPYTLPVPKPRLAGSPLHPPQG